MFCTNCGKSIEEDAVFCPHCRYLVRSPSQASPAVGTYKLEDDRLARALLPVGRSAYAVAAGYLALVSILVWPLGIAAVIFAFLAVRDIRANPSKSGMGRVGFAFTLGGLTSLATLVLAGILIAELIRR